jgi:EpsI family protein
MILLASALVFTHFRSSGEAVALREPLDRFPVLIGTWQARESTLFDSEILGVLRPTGYVMRRYTSPDARNLWLFIGFWQSQRKGAQPHSPKNCLPGNGWEPLEASRLTVVMPGGNSLTANRMVVQREQERQLIFYWYQAQGTAIAGEMEAKVQMVRNAIFRNRTDGALIRVSSPVYNDIAETSARLVTFIQALGPILPGYLPD